MSSTKSQDDIRDLIIKIRQNDDNAFKILLQKYTPLIESSVNSLSGDDSLNAYRDDLIQDASLAFYNAVLAYDINQNDVAFGLYAKICVHNALVSQLRILKKNPGAFSISLAQQTYLPPGGSF